MAAETASITASDPILCDAPLPLSITLYPLGFPLTLESNSHCILEAAKESWGECRMLFDVAPIRLRAGVFGQQGPSPAPTPTFRGSLHLISIVADAANSAVCDLKARFAFCWVTPETAARRDYFRYFFLEAMGYSVLGAVSTPVHAACVERGGKGVLLCGESEAGKSSLAYACARRGWTYVCDDAANIVRQPDGPVVVGNCHSLRLRPDAPNLFPELVHRLTVQRPNGKTNLEVRTASVPGLQLQMESRVSHIVFLQRRPDAQPVLAPVASRVACERLFGVPASGPMSLRRAWRRSVRQLVRQAVASEIIYSDLDAAVARLENLVDGQV